MRTRGIMTQSSFSDNFCEILADLPPPPSGRSGGAVEVGGALQTARHTQRCSNGSEHRDNHINDCFPFFVFHKTFFTLKFEL